MGNSSNPHPLSPSCLKHCRGDGWEQHTSACGSGEEGFPALLPSGRMAAPGEGKEKDQPASKEEARLFVLLKRLGEKADSQLDWKVSHKQCQQQSSLFRNVSCIRFKSVCLDLILARCS